MTVGQLEQFHERELPQQSESNALQGDLVIAHVDPPESMSDGAEITEATSGSRQGTHSRQSSLGVSGLMRDLQLRSPTTSRQNTQDSLASSSLPTTRPLLLASSPTNEWRHARGYMEPEHVNFASLAWLDHIQPKQTALVRQFVADLKDGLLSVQSHDRLPGRRGVQFIPLADPNADKITYQFEEHNGRWSLSEIEFDKKASDGKREVSQFRARDISIPKEKWTLLPVELRTRVVEYVGQNTEARETLHNLSQTSRELALMSNPHQLIAIAHDLENAVHETKRFATYKRLLQYFDPRPASRHLPNLTARSTTDLLRDRASNPSGSRLENIPGVPIRIPKSGLTDLQRVSGLAGLAKNAGIGPFWRNDEALTLEQGKARAVQVIYQRVRDVVDICKRQEIPAKFKVHILLGLVELHEGHGIININCLQLVEGAADEMLAGQPEQHLDVLAGLTQCVFDFDDEAVGLAHFVRIMDRITKEPRYTQDQRVIALAKIARLIGSAPFGKIPPDHVVDLVDNILAAAKELKLPPNAEAEVLKALATTLGNWDDNSTAFNRLWGLAIGFNEPKPDQSIVEPELGQSIVRELLTHAKRSWVDGLSGHAFDMALQHFKEDVARGNDDALAMFNIILDTLPGAEDSYGAVEASIMKQLTDTVRTFPENRCADLLGRIAKSIPDFAIAERPHAPQWHRVELNVLDYFKNIALSALLYLMPTERQPVFTELSNVLDSLPQGKAESFNAIRNRAERRENPDVAEIRVPDHVGMLHDRIGAATWMLNLSADSLHHTAWPANKIAFDLVLSESGEPGLLDELQKAGVLAGLACVLEALPRTIRPESLQQLLAAADNLSEPHRQTTKDKILALAPAGIVRSLAS